MINRPRLELLIATNNSGKIKEIEHAFSHLPLNLRYLNEFPGIGSVDESGSTYEANAVLKALSYSDQTGLSALADDSGLEVDALDGGPGVLSARYGGDAPSDAERTQKLLRALENVPDEKRTARFVCTIALATGPDSSEANSERILHIAQGECNGLIAGEPRGSNGFGYDPVFLPDGYDQTFAELESGIKGAISHRARALADMYAFLGRWLAEGELDRVSDGP